MEEKNEGEKEKYPDKMVRVFRGIYSDVVLGDGFFLPDSKVDIICEWLGGYADALEMIWKNQGGIGDPKRAKHTMIRSFKRAVERMRKE